MVKITYTRRKIQGLKLGQAVARDLRKRIPPGSGARTAARDPNIELDLTGKLLTDEGLAEVADALMECILFQDENHPHGVVRLTELSVKGNSLTVAAMEKLAPVVRLSNFTLMKLDISGNEINITNKAQRCNWRTFLKSFEGCFMLKSIDLSGNNLGSAGFDGIAEAYLKSDLDFIEPARAPNLDDNGAAHGIGAQSKSLNLNNKRDNLTALAVENDANSRNEGTKVVELKDEALYASTRGLRSVPYLILMKSGNTTACAFHLWCMHMVHVGPEKLLEYLPAGKSMVPLEVIQNGAGIVYSLDEFGPLGSNLLNLGVRFLKDCSKVNDDFDLLNSGEGLDRDEIIKAREVCRRTQIEMERVKNRAVLDILTTEGLGIVELWNVAFKTMVVARALLLDDKDKRQSSTQSDEVDPFGPYGISDQASDFYDPQSASPWTNFTEEFPSLPDSPEKRNVRVMANQTAPTSGRKKRDHQVGSSQTSHAEMIKISSQAVAKPGPKSVSKQVGRFGLPMRLWTRIITEAIDESEVLSPQQQTRIIRYACDWDSIKQELKIKGGTEPEQIRKILNSMDCLTYSNFE
ncbi:hypothetical protein PRK78_006153 [Emydomyces testavorans]|uniref:Leucine rich repeat protein n=1 Tax=Emydomyces testavorans TaxID=2070801 RepID=A0AAF0DNL9_9EURO|nr:hypothetical protein PRK78_006153 [Emydomyces testavorans]